MTVAIHFCIAHLEEQLRLEAVESWEAASQKLMFVVRSEEPLAACTVRLLADEQPIWSSPLRLPPANGLQHPFVEEEDTAMMYITRHLLTDEQLTNAAHYSVQVMEEEQLVMELPLSIDFLHVEVLATEEELQSALFILEGTEEVHMEAETVQLTDDLEEHVDEEALEVVDIEREEPQLEQPIAPESVAKSMYSYELAHDVSILANVLQTLTKEQSFTLEHHIVTPVIEKNYELVIEKIGDVYSTVINDRTLRPMFLLENGQYRKQWDGDFASYYEWVKQHVATMFNISEDEFNRWNTLVITDEPVQYASVDVKSREQVLVSLFTYPAVLDIVEGKVTIVLHFNSGAYAVIRFTSEQSIESYIQLLQQTLQQVYILPTGEIAAPEVRATLPVQLKEASHYNQTSLGWELVSNQLPK